MLLPGMDIVLRDVLARCCDSHLIDERTFLDWLDSLPRTLRGPARCSRARVRLDKDIIGKSLAL